MLLEGKCVVITGAGSGVGRATATLFAAQGANVICADVRRDWADETAASIVEAGGAAVAVECNVSSEDDMMRTLECALGHFGHLDVMCNNAGVGTPRRGILLEDHTLEDFSRLVGINFQGVFLGSKYAMVRFKEQGGGGVILNTASVAGLVGWGGVVYGATKGAVIQLTRALAVEAAPFNVRVNSICPGGMPTTRFSALEPGGDPADKPEEFLKEMARRHPLGRYITPEDCAAASLFLASDSAQNITGVVLPIDGGYVAA